MGVHKGLAVPQGYVSGAGDQLYRSGDWYLAILKSILIIIGQLGSGKGANGADYARLYLLQFGQLSDLAYDFRAMIQPGQQASSPLKASDQQSFSAPNSVPKHS